MKAMIVAFIVTALIGFGANEALKQAGFSSADRTAGNNVRLD